MSLKNVFLIASLFFLSACSVVPKKETRVWVFPGEKVDVLQLSQGEYGEERFSFQVALSIKPDKLTMIGLDNLGRRAFSLQWDENGVVSEKASWMPEQLSADYVLNDLMLAFWPVEKIDFADVEEQGNTRILKEGGETVVLVTKMDQNPRWAGALVVENFRRNYRIRIQSRLSGEGQ